MLVYFNIQIISNIEYKINFRIIFLSLNVKLINYLKKKYQPLHFIFDNFTLILHIIHYKIEVNRLFPRETF